MRIWCSKMKCDGLRVSVGQTGPGRRWEGRAERLLGSAGGHARMVANAVDGDGRRLSSLFRLPWTELYGAIVEQFVDLLQRSAGQRSIRCAELSHSPT